MVELVAVADERGAGLIEILVAVAIMAIVFSAFLAALSTGSFSVTVVRERVTAENLARSQLEYVKNQDYITTTDYSLISVLSSYPGYSITVRSSVINPGLQLITVTIFHNGELTFTMEEYKVDR